MSIIIRIQNFYKLTFPFEISQLLKSLFTNTSLIPLKMHSILKERDLDIFSAVSLTEAQSSANSALVRNRGKNFFENPLKTNRRLRAAVGRGGGVVYVVRAQSRDGFVRSR